MVRIWTFDYFLTRDIIPPFDPMRFPSTRDRMSRSYNATSSLLSTCSTTPVLCECEMSKRVFSRASSLGSNHSFVEHARKRRREGETTQPTPGFNPNYTATAEDAARVDADPPLQKLLQAASASLKTAEGTETVVHWMRMTDLRSECFGIPP